ncbi:MAG: hypothetical protein R3F30_16435 [Planctomycetota bacterium]
MTAIDRKQPELRKHVLPSGTYLYATFDGKQRRYGRGDDPRSFARYPEDLQAWEANGGSLPTGSTPESLDIDDLCDHYLAFKEKQKGEAWMQSSGNRIRYAADALKAMFGTKPAMTFGPLDLHALRLSMIEGKKLCRDEINARICKIKGLFKWASTMQLVPSSVRNALAEVEAIRDEDFGVRINAPRTDVSEEVFEATLPYVAPNLDTVLRLLWLTGARPSEILRLRPMDLDRSEDDLWAVVLKDHKTAKRTREPRILLFGPEAQELLRPFLLLPEDELLFKPEERFREQCRRKRKARTSTIYASQEHYRARMRAQAIEEGLQEPRTHAEVYDHRDLRRAVESAVKAANAARARVRKEKELLPLPT